MRPGPRARAGWCGGRCAVLASTAAALAALLLLAAWRVRGAPRAALAGAARAAGGGGGSAAAAAACARAAAPPDALPPAGADAVARTFDAIYATRAWGADGEGSGFGSTHLVTRGAAAALEMLVHRHGVARLVDAPCGSAHWVPRLLARVRAWVPCFEYVGVDVVASVVAANRAKFAADALSAFAVADLAAPDAALPRGADLVLCRDAIQHLPLAAGVAVLETLARARARLVAVGSYALDDENRDIRAGDYFRVNLARAPFNLTGAIDVLDELSPRGSDKKFLLLFDGEALARTDFAAMRARVAEFVARGGRGGG